MGFYLGIDAGGTRTTARLVSDSGETLGVGEAGPGNTRVGVENALLEVERAFRRGREQREREIDDAEQQDGKGEELFHF